METITQILRKEFPEWNIHIANVEPLSIFNSTILLISFHEPKKDTIIIEPIFSHWSGDEIISHFKKILFKEEYLL